MDIQLATLQLINELLDEDSVNQEEEESLEAMNSLASAFIQEQLMDIVIQTLATLDEQVQEQKEAVFNILSR
jgi:hypothetical protein